MSRRAVPLLACLLALVSRPASAALRLQLLEGGGNAAPYGQMAVFVDMPVPNFQVAAIPPAAFTGDNCAERRNSGFGVVDRTVDIDPAPGALLRVFVRTEESYATRCPCGPGTCSVYPFCTVTFTGWSGHCSGLGTAVSGGYECSFVYSDDDTIGSTWMFSGGALQGQSSCVAVAAPPTTTTSTLPGSTPTTTLPNGGGGPDNPFQDFWDGLRVWLTDPARALRMLFDFFAPGRGGVTVTGTVTSVGTGLSTSAGAAAHVKKIVVVKGHARARRAGAIEIALKLTKRGRKLLATSPSVTIALTGTFRGHGSLKTDTTAVTITDPAASRTVASTPR